MMDYQVVAIMAAMFQVHDEQTQQRVPGVDYVIVDPEMYVAAARRLLAEAAKAPEGEPRTVESDLYEGRV